MARVYVGMSGGVDSSLSAALLVEQGHQVTGIYMKNWSQNLPGMTCPWAEDLADAKRVAVQLGIDFRVYDFEQEYKDKVVDYMLSEYQAGRTPNPDIMCNQEVKFRLFLDTALSDGAEYIATGHYARTKHGQLLQARDHDKDQTYFLYRISEQALRHTIFPLGEYMKSEVRAMARERSLWTAAKRESMGVCFVGSVGIREFLGEYIQTHPGDIVDKASGRIIGRHDGAIYYTLGQRHGLDVGGGLPYYVVGKDMSSNIVYVSAQLHDEHIWRTDIPLTNPHWINDEPAPGRYHVRIRHRARLVPVMLAREGDSWTLHLEEAERAVAPGQSAVVYDGGRCIGGGEIV